MDSDLAYELANVDAIGQAELAASGELSAVQLLEAAISRLEAALETAAVESAARVAGTDRIQGVSSHVMFVARGKAGPFRVEAEPMAGADGTVAVRTLMHDEGAGDRVTTVGSYLFRSA